VILGNDAVLAARPNSPWQLTHACRAAGFDIVVPPTLGDELVAGEFLERLSRERGRVMVASHCPRTRTLLARRATEPRIPAVRVVAPPVAAARALRLTYGASILVTYVGDCPAANDASINARFSPAGFLASIERQGITIAAQPDAMPPADAERWYRYLSVPGGLPALRWLARAPVNRVLRDVDASNVSGEGWANTRSDVLLDLSECSGCACGGQRALIEEVEPVRATKATVVAPFGLELSDEAPNPAAVAQRTREAPAPSPLLEEATPQAALGSTTDAESSVRSTVAPRAGVGPVGGSPRRPTAHNAHSVVSTSEPARTAVGRLAPAARTVTTPASAAPSVGTNAKRRSLTLLLLPIAVLVATAALGSGVYALAARRVPVATSRDRSVPGDSTASQLATPPVTPPGGPGTSATVSPAAARADSGGPEVTRPRGIVAPDSSADSVGRARRRAPRRPRVEVVPGWLPQGRRTFTPVDTLRAGRRDSSAARFKPDTIPRT
jgi:hypothetical protein